MITLNIIVIVCFSLNIFLINYSLSPKLYIVLKKKFVTNYMSLYNTNETLMLFFSIVSSTIYYSLFFLFFNLSFHTNYKGQFCKSTHNIFIVYKINYIS